MENFIFCAVNQESNADAFRILWNMCDLRHKKSKILLAVNYFCKKSP